MFKYLLVVASVAVVVYLVYSLYRMVSMPGQSYIGAPPQLSQSEQEIEHNLRRHINQIAGEIGERNVNTPEALEATLQYISSEFTKYGYEVQREDFISAGQYEVSNIYVELPGTTDEVVVVGAHYDTVPGSPGANDNTTGIAALLELARIHREDQSGPSIRFIAFVNEEPPFFGLDMGSMEHATRAMQRGENIICMFSLETIGFYTNEANSQRYPFPFSLFYPSTGNFLGFVGNSKSRAHVHRAILAFRETATIPSEGLSAPRIVADINRSDQISFWRYGIPAMMITDTADFRYTQYHQPTDTPEIINFPEFARVVYGLTGVVREYMK